MAISVQLTELGEVPPIEWHQLTLMHSPHHVDHARFLVARDEGVIVGVAQLYEDDSTSNVHLVGLEAITPRRGVAKELVHALFDYADKAHKIVTVGGYTDQGRSHLRAVLKREAAVHKCGFHEIPGV